MLDYIYLVILIGYVFLTVGLMIKEKLLVSMMGMLLTVTGIYMASSGFGGVNNNITELFGVITTIIGSVFFLKYGMEELEKIDI